MRPLCAVMTRYPCDQQYPLGSIDTLALGVCISGGGCDASVYSVNWRCNFVMSVISARSYVVSILFVVENVPTAWRSAVVTVARFASAWAWVCYT